MIREKHDKYDGQTQRAHKYDGQTYRHTTVNQRRFNVKLNGRCFNVVCPLGILAVIMFEQYHAAKYKMLASDYMLWNVLWSSLSVWVVISYSFIGLIWLIKLIIIMWHRNESIFYLKLLQQLYYFTTVSHPFLIHLLLVCPSNTVSLLQFVFICMLVIADMLL